MTLLFLDIETTVTPHPEAKGLLVAGYAVDDGPITVVDFTARGPAWHRPDELMSLLADPEVATVEHSLYDARYIRLSGRAEVAGPVVNTGVMAWTMNENTPLDLDFLAYRYAGVKMDKRLHRSAGKVYFVDDDGTEYDLNLWLEWSGTEAWARFLDYNRRDVDALRKLYWALHERLDESEWLEYWEAEEVPYTAVLLDMESRGLPVDVAQVRQLAEELAPERDRIGRELVEMAHLPPSFNINSGDQLAVYLFSRVATFTDALVYDRETIECIKSCLDGEHEDCEQVAWNPKDGWEPDLAHDTVMTGVRHMVDLLPEGFTLDKLGRDRVHGHWTVKGRGLAPTPPTKNPLTGEEGKRPSTSSPELLYAHAGDEFVRKLCTEYRKVNTLLTTFLTRWPEEAHEGRLYGRFNQTGTVTGRLSSAGPNLQNVPARGKRGKQVRGLFRAMPGTRLIVGDYDQLEMRIMAHLSQDRRLLRTFREGRDPHTELAYAIWGRNIDPEEVPPGAACSYRDAAKTLNYAMGYGAGPKKIAQTLSLLGWPTTKETAKGYLIEMARYYSGLFRWKQAVIDAAKRKGFATTMGGRKRRLRSTFKDTANWKLVGYGERQAVNAMVQGTAADIVRRGMVAYDQTGVAEDAPMLAQVHDEVVFEDLGTGELHDTLVVIKHTFETAHGFELSVPLLFDPHTGESWAEAKAGEDTELAALLEEDE